MNCVSLVGNLARDPELRKTQSGIATCSFTIAVNRPKNKEGIQQADFITIVTWRAAAENCAKYLAKGRKVGVKGELRTRTYDDKNGVKHYVTEVLANEVEFLSPKGQGGYQQDETQGAEAPAAPDSSGFVQVSDDDLPF